MNETASATKIDYMQVRLITPEPLMSETWDWESAVKMPAVKHPRAIVSVAFSAEQFERVSLAAERAGKATSRFIRERALRGLR